MHHGEPAAFWLKGRQGHLGKPILSLCLGQGLKLNQLSHALRVGLSPALGFVGCVCVCVGLLGNEDPPSEATHTLLHHAVDAPMTHSFVPSSLSAYAACDATCLLSYLHPEATPQGHHNYKSPS